MVLSSLTLRLVGSLGVKVRVDGDRSANTWGMVWCKGTSMKDVCIEGEVEGWPNGRPDDTDRLRYCDSYIGSTQ